MAVDGPGGEYAEELRGIPKAGDVVAGKFTVEHVLGIGGMGVVVAARHVHLGQRVAIKFLRKDAAKNTEAVSRFLREARAAVNLQSPNVVRVMDVGTLDDGLPFMVMEHLSGVDLGEVLDRRKALPVEEAVDYVLQGMEAIAEAHAMGLVHRDLKPANLFLAQRPDGSGLVKVLDFGISKATEGGSSAEQSLTATSAVMGSPMYMSPEQLRSAKNVDVRTDIWALGVILYELTTGHTPFEAETVTGLCSKIAADPPVSLRTYRPELPPAFEAVVMRCVEKDVRKRPQSVGELATTLKPFASAEGKHAVDRVVRIGAPRVPSVDVPEAVPSGPGPTSGVHSTTGFADTVATWQTAGGKKRRRTMTLVAAGVAGAAVLGIGAAVLLRGPHVPTTATVEPAAAQTAAAPATTTAPAATAPPAASTAEATPPPAPSASAASPPAHATAAATPAAKPAWATAPPPKAAGAAKPAPKASPDDLLLDRK